MMATVFETSSAPLSVFGVPILGACEQQGSPWTTVLLLFPLGPGHEELALLAIGEIYLRNAVSFAAPPRLEAHHPSP
jgi:hypothetical protein